MIDLYGIPNCDTVKKARKWLESQELEYGFHDFKKEGVTSSQLEEWIAQTDLDVVLNKRGTTWRKLPDAVKNDLDHDKAIQLMIENPSMIKRPILIRQDGSVHVGFKPEQYAEILGR